MSTLTILKTIQEDEAVYHCAVTTWSKDQWSGTYLSLRGNTQRMTNYTVVQWPTVSDPVRPGDSVTLQCSVLSESEKTSCSGEHSVHWFGVRSDKSYANIIYTAGNRRDECDKRPDAHSPPKSCVYHFSKNVSFSDAGTYYCAVATCGDIIFGNGTKLDIEEQRASLEFIALVIAILCLVISVIGNIVFICNRTPRAVREQFKGIESASLQARHDNMSRPVHDITEGGDDLNYAALHLTGRKAPTGRKKKELKTEESVYSQIKC
ncbi:uncharacterized protein [Enoplosus armatus]|uniref:uncharacterized protein n=1 Tax=Enoplosus armatus TaxID=215367 RepID=UPI003996A7AD